MTKRRLATPTVAFLDQYCARYHALFSHVRHFERFPALHLGPLAETRQHLQAVRTGLAALGSLMDTFRLALPT